MIVLFFHLRSPWPDFMETLDEMDPWDREPCFLRLLHDSSSRASFFKPDVWHTINLGAGRSWLSNSVVMFIYTLDDLKAMTHDDVLAFSSRDYIAYCESSDPWLLLMALCIYHFLFCAILFAMPTLQVFFMAPFYPHACNNKTHLTFGSWPRYQNEPST